MDENNGEDYIKEKDLNGYSKSLSMEEMEIIFTQMKKSLCYIECKDNGHGTGFFL